MLFSEPKIPQSYHVWRDVRRPSGFSALQRAENSSILSKFSEIPTTFGFSALQRAENSSIDLGTSLVNIFQMFQCSSASRKFLNHILMMFLSEQSSGFSALQRAENSSIHGLNAKKKKKKSFSALQRAENSSMHEGFDTVRLKPRFQCSSASRKFLNLLSNCLNSCRKRFQCSSASRKFLNRTAAQTSYPQIDVSVLFSEPKIPQ